MIRGFIGDALVVVVWIVVAGFVVRSRVGQRFEGGFYPKWVMVIARHRPPRFFKSAPMLTVTWASRWASIILVAIAGSRMLAVVTGAGKDALFPALSTVTWVTLAALAVTLYTAGYVFQPRKRVGPTALWVGYILGLAPTVMGASFAVVAAGYKFLGFGPIPNVPITRALTLWSHAHSYQDTVGVAVTLVGLGIANLALQESLPDIGDEEVTPSDMAPRLTATSSSETHAMTTRSPNVSAAPSGRRRRKRKARKRLR